MMLTIVKRKLIGTFHPLHAKLDYQLRRNETLFHDAVQRWFAFTIKQIQTELRTKFQKDITSELTDWEYLDEHGKQILKPTTLKVMQSGGGEAYKMLQVSGAFDVLNVNAVKAAEKFTADLVRQVNADTKKGIRSHISQGIKDGKSMDKLARELRPLVGLTANQTQSITKYRTLLGDKDRFPGLSASDIDKKVQHYSDKTHRRRMKTIVRTETARAQTIGYVMGMDDLGITQLEFRVAPTDFCEICEGLNKEKYGIDEGAGVIPVHPNCRCVLLPVISNTPVCSGLPGEVAKSTCFMPDSLHAEQIKDLISRWDSAKAAGNKWNIAQKLKRFGYDVKTGKPPVVTAPKIKAPEFVPKPKSKPKLEPFKTIDEWEDNLTWAQQDAFEAYVSGPSGGMANFVEIQRKLLQGTISPKQVDLATLKIIKNIETALARAPGHKGEIWRGMNFKNTTDPQWIRLKTSMESGKPFAFESMQSFSMDKYIADRFAKGKGKVQVKIRMKKGSSRGAEIAEISELPEAEVLVGADSTYKLVSKTEKMVGKIKQILYEIEEIL